MQPQITGRGHAQHARIGDVLCKQRDTVTGRNRQPRLYERRIDGRCID